jgi:hypothetical protein
VIAHLNGGAYNGSQVLSPEGIATLHAPGAQMGASSSYAMGWVVHDQAGSLRLEHNGDVSNFLRQQPTLLLLALLIAVVWLTGSIVFNQRWQRRGKLPVRGWSILWRYGFPLAVDVGLGGAAWIVLPAQVQTPIATIGLFVPDVFAIIVVLTVLSLACALGRSVLVFRSSHQAGLYPGTVNRKAQ